MRQSPASAALEERIANLDGMELEALRAEWQRLYRRMPPARLSRDLLARCIADKLQEAALGGLRAATKRKLAALQRTGHDPDGAEPAAPASLQPGAMLVRTWRGETHTVQVVQGGYEHAGMRYRSLSQIAMVITGAHWSGPRFFGIRSQRVTGGKRA